MSTAPHTSGGARPPASVSAASPQPRNASGRPAGTWGTVLLPIADDESIDYTALGEEVEALGESGVDGVYTNGSAGEFYAQSEQEFDQIHNLVARICHACGLSFQIGVSHTGAQTTLDRIARAKDLGPTAFQIILPDWVPLSNEEAIRYLARIAEEASPVPLVLYNPPHAKRVLQADDFLQLSNAVPELVGLKVGDGDEGWYQSMQPVMSRLAVFVPGHRLALGVSRGAQGSYSNIACLHPKGAKRWAEQMKRDLPAALELQKRIEFFLEQHVLPLRSARWHCNHAFDKLLAAAGGWAKIGTRLRWPYQWFDPSLAYPLGVLAKQQLPELFEEN